MTTTKAKAAPDATNIESGGDGERLRTLSASHGSTTEQHMSTEIVKGKIYT